MVQLPPRRDKDLYFMRIAQVVATKSTCIRRQVGAVLVKDDHILATGYNGAPSKLPHCTDIGTCLRIEQKIPSGTKHELCRAVHAEQNAIAQAAKYGVSVDGGTIYCTASPCAICLKLCINAGITKFICLEKYPDPLAEEILVQSTIDLIIL